MENVLLVYVIVMGAILLALVFLLFQRNGESERRLARVRVRIDDNRQPARMEPEEEEYEPLPRPALLIGGALVLIIIVVSSMQ
jgi:hypothetical protein